ncbi:MAG: LytR/AlgR family response regulator transcription factor [Saprospiraceae bacterium]
MINAVIIDDVPQARETLKADLKTYCPEIKLLGEAEGVVSGLKLLKKMKPALVFLDIQMPDGTGFDLLELVGPLDFKVIFTTASDEFAIKAFRFAAVDYLLKPIDPDDLLEAVKKAKDQQVSSKANIDLLLDSVKTQQAPKRIALHTQEKIQVVDISNIIHCESTGNYTIFYFQNGEKLLVTKTLKEFDLLFQEHHFLRVHQSHLINTQQIKEYVKTEGGYLVMQDGSRIPVSVRKKAGLIKLLENL